MRRLSFRSHSGLVGGHSGQVMALSWCGVKMNWGGVVVVDMQGTFL